MFWQLQTNNSINTSAKACSQDTVLALPESFSKLIYKEVFEIIMYIISSVLVYIATYHLQQCCIYVTMHILHKRDHNIIIIMFPYSQYTHINLMAQQCEFLIGKSGFLFLKKQSLLESEDWLDVLITERAGRHYISPLRYHITQLCTKVPYFNFINRQ